MNLIRTFLLKYLKRKDPVAYARHLGVRVGNNCRLINVKFGSEPYLVGLGDHVSATETEFITHDGGLWIFRDKNPNCEMIAPIKVGNNVYFGSGVKVMPGITIGDNVVVGAGAIVTKDLPSNCVAVGIPARIIKTTDDYYKSISNEMTDTKGLPESQKKKYLLEKYKNFLADK